jgi:heme oxygenase
MLSDRLKRETQGPHLDLEKLIIPKLKSVKDTVSYADLLWLFYGFFQPVEQLINQYIGKDELEDYVERRKATVIQDDLRYIRMEASKVAVCRDLPIIDSITAALGAMYVLEGSTLGGKIISKMLINQLQLEGNHGVRFFSGYGEATAEKWFAFREYLDNYSSEPEEQDKMINAAKETFLKFGRWVEAN